MRLFRCSFPHRRHLLEIAPYWNAQPPALYPSCSSRPLPASLLSARLVQLFLWAASRLAAVMYDWNVLGGDARLAAQTLLGEEYVAEALHEQSAGGLVAEEYFSLEGTFQGDENVLELRSEIDQLHTWISRHYLHTSALSPHALLSVFLNLPSAATVNAPRIVPALQRALELHCMKSLFEVWIDAAKSGALSSLVDSLQLLLTHCHSPTFLSLNAPSHPPLEALSGLADYVAAWPPHVPVSQVVALSLCRSVAPAAASIAAVNVRSFLSSFVFHRGALQRVLVSCVPLLASLGRVWPQALQQLASPADVIVLPLALHALSIGPSTSLCAALRRPLNAESLVQHRRLYAHASLHLLEISFEPERRTYAERARVFVENHLVGEQKKKKYNSSNNLTILFLLESSCISLSGEERHAGSVGEILGCA